MHRRTTTARRMTVFAAGLSAAALLCATPAQADPVDDAFIDTLGSAGLGMANPADAVALGQSVCPMLSQPGQSAADAAAQVADAAGMSLGPATMFTGLAISAFCPGVMASIGNGQNPLPFGLLGF